MLQHNLSPNYIAIQEQSKDTHSQQKIKINPVFEDLNNPTTILTHVEELKGKKETTPHARILHQLIDQLGPIDFEVLAFPEAKKLREQLCEAVPGSKQAKEIQMQLDKLRLTLKHYLVLSIENILQFPDNNHWGLCKNHDFIYLYNGSFWSEVDKEAFQKFLGEAAEKLGVVKYSARFYQFKEQLFKQFLATAYLPTPEHKKATVLINLQNGTFEIRSNGTTILRPFDRSDFITYQLPFEYNTQAKTPIFDTYLKRVLPDPECQRVLAEYLGFLFIKHGSSTLKEEKALILYGTGANGKSVFFEVVNALLGSENVSNYSLQSLTNENGYFRAKIANKLLNYASEINVKLETSIFKLLVSGEPVEARLPYGEPFTLNEYAKFIFNCNELPKDIEHTNAYFRRFLIIPFDVTIPTEEQDKNLHAKIIEAELAGVFNWVLDGLKRLLKQQRFSDCGAAQRALEKYKMESDSVQMFLSDNEYSVSSTHQTLLKYIYNEYKEYCIESGFKVCSMRTFAERMRRLGYQTDRKNIGTVIYAKK